MDFTVEWNPGASGEGSLLRVRRKESEGIYLEEGGGEEEREEGGKGDGRGERKYFDTVGPLDHVGRFDDGDLDVAVDVAQEEECREQRKQGGNLMDKARLGNRAARCIRVVHQLNVLALFPEDFTESSVRDTVDRANDIPETE